MLTEKPRSLDWASVHEKRRQTDKIVVRHDLDYLALLGKPRRALLRPLSVRSMPTTRVFQLCAGSQYRKPYPNANNMEHEYSLRGRTFFLGKYGSCAIRAVH
jgi:hypothetical protein